ncbi:MAG TPA: fatty acid desaturase [Tepidisphaeraceae bacterium]|jgi:stearoyl-CoA desaturase (delta-9 desaturase)
MTTLPSPESTHALTPGPDSASPDAPVEGLKLRGHSHDRPSLMVKVSNLAAVILPFVGFIVAAVMLWGIGFSWLHLGLMVAMYLLSAIGITVGYHRLFTHRAFETNRVMKATFAILGSMAVEGPLLKWVAMHRRHHQHSDEENDPHSPHLHGEGLWGMVTGLWHAHVGWIFDRDPEGIERYVGDLAKDRVLRYISDTFPLWVLVGLLIPTILGGVISMTWTGALLGLIWGGFARIFLVHHVTWSINSVCHLWGSRDYESHDESRNNFVFGVLALGEGWHNNHHAFPTSARHGLKWWQVDASYYIIAGMEAVGLASKVRLPSPQAMQAKQRKDPTD